jgi:pimeloyl-ACP methyl ester carboxylesterase
VRADQSPAYAGPVTNPPAQHFRTSDGLELAYREIGEGRPLVLIHGFTSNGMQWIDQGPASAIAARGFRVILPDLRGHGESPRPHDPAAYPPDILLDDALAFIDHLGLVDYDLGGYSLGGRVVLRMLTRGATPARAIVAGQGLSAITRQTRGNGAYRRVLSAMLDDSVDPDSPDAMSAYWIKQLGNDPQALLHVLDSHVGATLDDVRKVATPVLVVVGDEDDANADADELAAELPDAHFARIPGDHYTAFIAPEFAAATLDFLTF